MSHVVLLGDSVFDNAAYVAGPDVVAQLRAILPQGWKATLLALDGAMIADIKGQLAQLPSDATHLVLSVGGNDALQHEYLIAEKAGSVAEVLARFASIREDFERDYSAMLDAVVARKLPTAVCTIYEARYPEAEARRLVAAGLTLFNDIITRAVFERGLPLIDLRLIFTEEADYAYPIEPSLQGGEKLARVIARLLTTHDFSRPRSAVFA